MSYRGYNSSANQLMETPPGSAMLQPDPHLSRSFVAIAVSLGLILAFGILFVSLLFGRFWPLPGRTPTCTSTADQSTVALALLVTDPTSSGCPLAEDDCTTATAQEVAYGNLTLQDDTSLIVGLYSSQCTTIGASAESDEGTDRRCDITLILNGEGGLDAGVLTLAGIKTVAEEEETFPHAFGVTGGNLANLARPIGGQVVLAYNSSTTELTLTGSVILVN